MIYNELNAVKKTVLRNRIEYRIFEEVDKIMPWLKNFPCLIRH